MSSMYIRWFNFSGDWRFISPSAFLKYVTEWHHYFNELQWWEQVSLEDASMDFYLCKDLTSRYQLHSLTFDGFHDEVYDFVGYLIDFQILRYYHFTHLRVFHISISWWFLIGVWVIEILLKSSEHFLIFWPILKYFRLDGLHSSSYF